MIGEPKSHTSFATEHTHSFLSLILVPVICGYSIIPPSWTLQSKISHYHILCYLAFVITICDKKDTQICEHDATTDKSNKQWSSNTGAFCDTSSLLLCVRCFGEDTCLSIPDIKAVVMVLPPSEPRITITGSNRLVRPASDLRGPLGVAPFKELHITSTVMKGDNFGGCEWRGFLCC